MTQISEIMIARRCSYTQAKLLAETEAHSLTGPIPCPACGSTATSLTDSQALREKSMTTTTPKTPIPSEPAVASSDGLDALVQFLESHGADFLRWNDGRIVVETYFDKKFRAIGGDTNRLISFFEDYGDMHDASRHYISALRNTERRPAP